jgi:hypothetical protein
MFKGIHSLNADMAEAIADAFMQVLENKSGAHERLKQYSLAAGHAVVGQCHALADYWLDHPEESVLRMAGTAMAVSWKGFDALIEDTQPWLPTEAMLVDLI